VITLQRARWLARGCKGPRDECATVLDDEWVLRRVHKNHFKPQKPTPIERVAFQPSDEDVEGLSVFRAAFVTPSQIVAASRGGNNYYVAKLAVSDLVKFSPPLTVKPDSDADQPPGHAVVPELNATRLKSDKYPSKELQRDLAKLASKHIVWRPDDKIPPSLLNRAIGLATSWIPRRD
jgi:hypothetical protein